MTPEQIEARRKIIVGVMGSMDDVRSRLAICLLQDARGGTADASVDLRRCRALLGLAIDGINEALGERA